MVKVADEVWIATALLHQEHPERKSFAIGEIVARATREGLQAPLRPGVQVHASQHCVANKPPNPGAYRMLFATRNGDRRLFKRGDQAHPARSGKITPDLNDLPAQYRSLLDWYGKVYDAPRSGGGETITSLPELEADVQNQTERELIDAQGLLERVLNLYLEGFRRLGTYVPSEDRDPRILMLALATRSFNSARCAYDLARRGYYQQSIALSRMIQEDWLTSYDVAFKEETRNALWEKRRVRSFQDMADDIAEQPTNGTGQWWKESYGTPSEISHPRGLSLAMQFENETIRLGPIYARDLALGSLAIAIEAAKRMLTVFNYVFSVGLDAELDQFGRDIREWFAWLKDERPVAVDLTRESARPQS